MPYKNPEKWREYNTLYKQRVRKAQARKQPAVRIFICPRFPSLRVGPASFDGGFLITNKAYVIEQILQDREYMVHIFPVAIDLDLIPTPTINEDDSGPFMKIN